MWKREEGVILIGRGKQPGKQQNGVADDGSYTKDIRCKDGHQQALKGTSFTVCSRNCVPEAPPVGRHGTRNTLVSFHGQSSKKSKLTQNRDIGKEGAGAPCKKGVDFCSGSLYSLTEHLGCESEQCRKNELWLRPSTLSPLMILMQLIKGSDQGEYGAAASVPI